jgi:hypothetical protein
MTHVLELFDKRFVLILNNGCEIWGFAEVKKLENIHVHFYKSFLGVRPQTQNSFILFIVN